MILSPSRSGAGWPYDQSKLRRVNRLKTMLPSWDRTTRRPPTRGCWHPVRRRPGPFRSSARRLETPPGLQPCCPVGPGARTGAIDFRRSEKITVVDDSPCREDLSIDQPYLGVELVSGLHRAGTCPLTLDLSGERLDA